MRRQHLPKLTTAIGAAALLLAGIVTGTALRSDDSPAMTDDMGATQAALYEEGTPVSGLVILREFHHEMVESAGALLEGKLNSEGAANGLLVLDNPAIVWAVDISKTRELLHQGQLSTSIPDSIDPTTLAKSSELASSTLVAITGEGHLVGFASTDQTGAFLLWTEPTELSNALTMGGNELFETQYTPRSANPCDQPEHPNYESPADALKTYLLSLGVQTEIAAQEATSELRRRVNENFANSPAFVDPVTGFGVTASANDIQDQLKEDPTKDVELRAAIPVELELLTREEAEAAVGIAVVFIDVKREQVLGWLPLATQHGAAEGVPIGTTILELSPPLDGSDVAMVLRPESAAGVGCGLIGGSEPELLIRHEDLAGKTRVSISLANLSYSTVTDFELNQ